MASDSDRNLWDAIGLANNTDLSSTQEKEQSLCNNGTPERALDSTMTGTIQGTSLGRKSAAEPDLVSILDMVSCSKCPDVPAANGSYSVEQRNHREAEEHIAVVAVNVNNSEQKETPVARQERSIFEHINNNFRPSVIISQSNGRENGPSENGVHKTTGETTVLSNLDCLPSEGTKRNVETSDNTEGEKNIFERVRINSYIDSLAQQTSFTKEGNGGFPFSDKLRQLTTINKETGKMSTSVHPLRTGYDAVTSGRTFQQLAPTSGPHSRPAGNVVSARIVNGQLQSLGTQVIAPREASHVDANVIFPSVTPIKYANPASTSSNINNSNPNQDVLPGFNAVDGNTVVKNNGVIEANSTIIQPNAVAKLKRIASEKPSGEHAQSNLVPTHLVGPFISTGPPPPNSYVAAVRTTHGQALHNGLQLSAYPSQLQAVHSPLKRHTSPAGFQLVLPVLTPPSPVVNRIILPQPTAAERNVSTDKQLNLVCGERLVASPDLPERVFRPVSPARVGFYTNASPRVSQEHVLFQARRRHHSSPLGARRSIFTRKTDIDRRGSVEEELADQSYECALRESANSPDIERYLRCESPMTVLSSPNFKSNTCSGECYSMESCDSHVDSIAVCHGECEDIAIASQPAERCEDFSTPKSPERMFLGESDKSAEASKRKLNSAMVRRLEPRLPSPVREHNGGDLYRDPSQLTREERALQRAMMQFSEMEMKEKAKQTNKKVSFKRRLRKRGKDKTKTIVNGNKKQTATKVWLKKFKRKRLWFSQRRSITVKQPVQDDTAAVKSGVDHQTLVKRKRFHSPHDNEQPVKTRRKSTETEKQAVVGKPKDVFETTEVSPDRKSTDNKAANLRRSSSDTRRCKKTKPENIPESTSCKRSSNTPDLDMGKKVLKRARVELEPLQVKSQESTPHKSSGISKADKSHRVKTYMLVTAYQGFRDFKPIVLESRTRGKSKHTNEESPQKTPKASEFPLLVVESVNSKPVKNSVIAENEEVQHFVENCLKARGKWQVGRTIEEPHEGNDDDTLKEARKLNVNRNTGETILHKAARLGYHETVHHHIHQGIDPNAKDNAGWTPLHEACSRGKVGVVKVLAKYGADVNACSNDGIRPIHDAAEGGHVGVLRVLLSYGADPLLATYSGNSALSCTKDSNTRYFLDGFLEDLDLKTSSVSATESEGCWEFSGSCSVLDESSDHTSGIFEGVPLSDSVLQGEFEMCDRPHLPTYNLPVMISDDSTSGRRNYVLLSDLLEHLRITRTALFKKARKLEIREMPWSQFLCEIVDKPLCMVPKYSPPDSSVQEGVAELVAINYNLRRLLNIRVESVNMT